MRRVNGLLKFKNRKRFIMKKRNHLLLTSLICAFTLSAYATPVFAQPIANKTTEASVQINEGPFDFSVEGAAITFTPQEFTYAQRALVNTIAPVSESTITVNLKDDRYNTNGYTIQATFKGTASSPLDSAKITLNAAPVITDNQEGIEGKPVDGPTAIKTETELIHGIPTTLISTSYDVAEGKGSWTVKYTVKDLTIDAGKLAPVDASGTITWENSNTPT